VAKKAGSTSARKRVDYHWDVQRIASEKMGHDFKRLIVKYGKYRPSDKDIEFMAEGVVKGQITVRCSEPGWYITKDDGTYAKAEQSTKGAYLAVTYSARPFEARKDTATLPGTA